MIWPFQNKPTPHKIHAKKLYQLTVDKIRTPSFFSQWDIEDTPLSRFELLTVQLFILLRQLKCQNTRLSQEISQELCNLFAADMDHSLRDIRLSELKIDRQYKKFIEGFYGRIVAYDVAMSLSDPKEQSIKLVEALLKNVYSNDNMKIKQAYNLACYILEELNSAETNDQREKRKIA